MHLHSDSEAMESENPHACLHTDPILELAQRCVLRARQVVGDQERTAI